MTNSFQAWGKDVKRWYESMVAAHRQSVADGSSYEFNSFDAGYTAGISDALAMQTQLMESGQTGTDGSQKPNDADAIRSAKAGRNDLSLEVLQAVEPVAVIGRDWQLLYVGAEPLAALVRRHQLKIGAKLYVSPPQEEAVSVLRERIESAERCMLMLTADHNSGPHYVRGFDMAHQHFAKYPNPAKE